MTFLFFWLVWVSVASIGIKYVSMQLLNVDLSYVSAFLILIIYQWIRFIKPLSKEETNRINKIKRNKEKIVSKPISDFNSIINSNFKKKRDK